MALAIHSFLFRTRRLDQSQTVIRAAIISIALTVGALATFAADEPSVTVDELPRRPATPPAKSIDTFHVRPGFRAQLVAAEPLVVDPVAMAFDEAGRLFVVEMKDYSERREERLGRIRMLEDTNHDGIFDRSTVYVENLPWPTAVICFDGGLFVAASPDIIYCKDTNYDGIADERKVVFTGFGEGIERLNVQQLLNSFNWSYDCRIHGASGGNGGVIRISSRPDLPPLPLRGRDFSFDPKTLDFRAESGGGQYGLSFDNRGRKFVCSNSSHIRAVVYEDRYAGRNPYYPLPPAAIDIPVDGPAAEVFRISPDEPWRVIRTRWRVAGQVPGPIEGGGRPSGYFTGATGITIYRGDAWPQDLVGDAFIADCGSNLIHRKKVRGAGASMKAERAADEQRTEFLASTDNWFRPVQFANAPDGSLYFADMYREVIEHPWSLPPGLKSHLDLNSGNDRGRIFRIVPESFVQPKAFNLGTSNAADLVKALDHPNAWHRETAARLLFERRPPEIESGVRTLSRESRSPWAKIHALYLLASFRVLRQSDLEAGLRDGAAEVRQHAVRLAEKSLGSPDLLKELALLAHDPDTEVRRQLAFSLGESSAKQVPEILARLLINATDPWEIHAALNSARDHAVPLLVALLQTPSARPETLHALAVMIGARNGTDNVELAAAAIAQLYKTSKNAWASEVELAAGAGLVEGLRRGGHPIEAFTTLTALAPVHRIALQLSTNRNANGSLRIYAMQWVSAFDSSADRDALETVLSEVGSPTAQSMALSLLAHADDGRRVVRQWEAFTPNLRLQAIQFLLARTNSTMTLLRAVEEGAIGRGEVSRSQLQTMVRHPDAGVRETSERIFRMASRGAKQTLVDASLVLKRNGDSAAGKKIYTDRCSSCHRFRGNGYTAGPDIESVQASGREVLLGNILDPNREVAPKYMGYLVETRSGDQWNGLIAAESDAAVTMRAGGGFEKVVPRSEIVAFKSSGQSLMPEGLAEGLTEQDLANLLEFLAPAAAAK